MTGRILDGEATAERVRDNVNEAVSILRKEHGLRPRLDAILVGDDPASTVYVRKKREDCKEVGLESRLHTFPASADQDAILTKLGELNEEDLCDGLLVQLPLPDGIDTPTVLEAVDPTKDADGFHPVNLGRLIAGRGRLAPATPTGILHLLGAYDVNLEGAEAVIVGRSTIVGKPMAALLSQRGVDATVTLCHSRTQDLNSHTRRADVLVVAAGKRDLVTSDMIKPGATVIDVGINRDDEGNLTGDVAYEEVAEKAGAITPVPGGVGPLTRAMLLVNVTRAACLRRGIAMPSPLTEVVPRSLCG